MRRIPALALAVLAAACGGGGGVPIPAPLAGAQAEFVNWEDLAVHPLDLTPDGATLLACNTADHRLEILDVSSGIPVPAGSVPVGLDPVSVRARTDTEAWVVNHVSDTVSVVDLAARRVVATLPTRDEPCDVVFASGKAFVSCSQANAVLVFDPADPGAAPEVVAIGAEDPRALAVSADGSEVYVAIFESGNATTALGGGASAGSAVAFPPSVVSDPDGPHGGVNPPPNAGAAFDPPQRTGNPAPPAVGLIVRRDAAGSWRDDTGADWTDFVSGGQAARSGRRPGWDLVDRDVAIIDTATHAVRYATGCMNICMALAVQPGTGRVTVVGTDATNEIRYEPNLSGRFLRVRAASVDPAAPANPALTDLNPHLDYTTASVPQSERDRSLGDPRGIAWSGDGQRGFIAGMGSDNLVVVDAALARVGRVEVGQGPAGVVLSNDGARAYVLNRFENSVSVVDTAALAETARVAFFDPTPAFVRRGRRELYGTHETSGLGHAACASCHVDARMDRLAWDLGDPAGFVKPFDQNCLTEIIASCEDFHPMKGPMLTQTLQDIVGKEPHHWRGDRDGLEEFNGAFVSLLGDDTSLTGPQMQDFEDFLATIRFPPNPFRTLENDLPERLDLPGHFTPGRFGPAGEPLPAGDPRRGLDLYRNGSLDGGVPGFQCVTCHTLPTGIGPDLDLQTLEPSPVGPNGERHHSLVSVDGSTNVSMKIPQLRNLYDRTGFETTALENTAGFGFLHDGSVDSIARFVAEPVFDVGSVQDVADLVAFMLCFSGSDLPAPRSSDPAGPESRDTHAAVGKQTTFGATRDEALLARLLALADAGEVDLVAHQGESGWVYDAANGVFRADRNGETNTLAEVKAQDHVTFTAVPAGTGQRLGIDRDDDGYGNGTERDFGTDPADANDFPR